MTIDEESGEDEEDILDDITKAGQGDIWVFLGDDDNKSLTR